MSEDGAAYDVAVVGCGPTGVVLANLLGGLGVRVAVLERDREVYPVPRATHIDEETVRNFQATGLVDALLPHTTPFGTVTFVDEDGSEIWRDAVEDPDTPHGYAGSCFFDQPAFERVLRDGLARYPGVRLLAGVDVLGVEDDGGAVTVRAKHAGSDEPIAIRASWAVGCDGGRSVVRDAIGVEMEEVAPKRPWLIVDTLLKDPADAALLPDGFRYVFARERLTVYAHGIGLNRRWEFQLADGEDVPSREQAVEWVSAYVDPSRLEILRVVPYAHTSLVAKRWRVGRVFVAGDAAHMMPPSAGQGMCSGVRDAMNLAWKLERAVAGRAGDPLLDTYERERSPHVRETLAGTIFIGKRLEASSPFGRWRRRQEMRLIRAFPSAREIARRKGIRRPPLRDGFLDRGSPTAGLALPQVEVRSGGGLRRLDELLGYRFALVAAPGALADGDAEWAAGRGVGVWRVGDDFEETGGRLVQWMRERRLDFALARPDRYIFAAGTSGDLARARAEFDRWLA